jgi:hypothetical protein
MTRYDGVCLSFQLHGRLRLEITVPGQLRQKKFRRPHLNRESWVWWHKPVTLATAKSLGRIEVQASLGKKQDLISKITRVKKRLGAH